MPTWRQIPQDLWRPERHPMPLAQVDVEPEDFRDLTFVPDVDGLGDLLWAALETADGWRFLLMRWSNSTVSGISVLSPVGEDRMAAALAAFIAAAGVSVDKLSWVSPLCS